MADTSCVHRLTRRVRSALVWLAGLVLLLTSCSSGHLKEARSSEVPAGTAQPAQARAQPGPTIRVLAPESRSLTALERLEIRHEANTGVRVEITKRALMQDVLTELDQEIASNRGTYDLVLVPNRALGRLVESGYVRSIEAYLEERIFSEDKGFVPQQDLFAGWWRATSWYRGNPYGYPFLARAMSLWYRSDLSDEEEADAFFTKYRHPMNASTTWDEYEHLAEFMHQPWRPETAIRAGDTDGNRKTEPDTTFAPFIATPCFPSYPSNHASGSYGGAEVLERIYGAGGHVITLTNTVAGLPMTIHYNRIKQITDDVDDARVYGGIHFRFDQEAGGRLGRDVGGTVYRRNLRRDHQGDHDREDDCDDHEHHGR